MRRARIAALGVVLDYTTHCGLGGYEVRKDGTLLGVVIPCTSRSSNHTWAVVRPQAPDDQITYDFRTRHDAVKSLLP